MTTESQDLGLTSHPLLSFNHYHHYLLCIYINTNTCMYIFMKICYVHMLNIFIYNIIEEYKYIHVNIFNILCVFIYK